MTTNTGQQGKKSWGQECWGRTARAGKSGQESLGWKAWAGKPGQDSWRMLGWYNQNKKERTGWPEHDRRTEQLEQDNCDGSIMAGQLCQ
jgi:hypothetical protein